MATAQSYFNKKYRIIRPDEWKSFMDADAYKDPTVRSATFDLTQDFAGKGVTMGSHFMMDAHLLHFRPYDKLVVNPLTKNSWKDMIQKELDNPKYQELNEKVSKNPMLSLMATKNFLQAYVDKAREAQAAIPPGMMPPQPQPQQQSQGSGQGNQQPNQQGNQASGSQGGQPSQQPFNFNDFMTALNNLQGGTMGNQALYNSITASMEQAASQAAEETSDMVSMLNSFSHAGIPMKRLTDPEEMREILSNKFVISLARVMKKMNTDDTGKSHIKPSVRRGIPIGTRKMLYYSEIPDVIPQDMIDPDILDYKIASKTAHVRERYSSMNNYLIYLDKSGSMGGGIEFIDDHVPKISVAAASAIGMAKTVREHGGKMTLRLFDTELGEPITDMWELLKTLSGIRADGGTDITKCLEDVLLKGRDYKSVLISDGIDSIDESVAKECAKVDLTSVLIRTSNELLERYTTAIKVQRFTGDNILMEV
ncbi:MAG: hypothetical protein QXW75_00540 [Thermoplasmatales archaeon]